MHCDDTMGCNKVIKIYFPIFFKRKKKRLVKFKFHEHVLSFKFHDCLHREQLGLNVNFFQCFQT